FQIIADPVEPLACTIKLPRLQLHHDASSHTLRQGRMTQDFKRTVFLNDVVSRGTTGVRNSHAVTRAAILIDRELLIRQDPIYGRLRGQIDGRSWTASLPRLKLFPIPLAISLSSQQRFDLLAPAIRVDSGDSQQLHKVFRGVRVQPGYVEVLHLPD